MLAIRSGTLGKLPRRMFLSVSSPNPSSRRPQQRSDVGDRPEVRQLVGVDDPADARDPTAGDVERQHADQSLLSVEKERSRAAVDLDGARQHARKSRYLAEKVDERARDAVAPAQRPRA